MHRSLPAIIWQRALFCHTVMTMTMPTFTFGDMPAWVRRLTVRIRSPQVHVQCAHCREQVCWALFWPRSYRTLLSADPGRQRHDRTSCLVCSWCPLNGIRSRR